MMIHSHSKDYEIEIYDTFDFTKALFALDHKLIVADRKVYGLYKDSVFSSLNAEDIFLIDATEDAKTMETVLAICERMTKLDAKKNANLISVGGGIIQDITGFVANILYRGINWHFVPTTLLASADSCLGSKTSLNFLNYKNLFGTFYPPNKVYICPLFVKTLDRDDYLSGLGEVVKFNVMAAAEGVDRLERDIDRLLAHDYALLVEYIRRSLSFKKPFVEEDEFDTGVRRLLNFAHTFGHAIESLSNYAVPHGQAVSVGMLIANRISVGRKLLTEETCKRIEAIVTKVISVEIKPDYLDPDKITAVMKKDKKRQGEGLAAVIIEESLKLKLVFDILPTEVERALKDIVVLL